MKAAIWRTIRPLRFALLAYLVPVVLLLMFIVDMITVWRGDMLFWVLFLLSLLPFGFIGTCIAAFVTVKGWKGLTGRSLLFHLAVLAYGVVNMGGGILALLLLYVVVGGA